MSSMLSTIIIIFVVVLCLLGLMEVEAFHTHGRSEVSHPYLEMGKPNAPSLRLKRQQQGQQQQQMCLGSMCMQQQQQMQGFGGGSGQQQQQQQMMMGAGGGSGGMMSSKDRKKSLMTRLIPGRGAAGVEAKRTGFARSEEVGVPESLLATNSSTDRLLQPPLLKQTSKESTDSSHSDNTWMPVLPEGQLGSFVDNLGPGQVVGRQVLASPILGEIQIAITYARATLDVEIVRARGLVVKSGAKISPAPYVKVYLMAGKQCIAKAKTVIVRRTLEPLFQQHLVFAETPRGRMLQITVIGDYGRMERKVPMGVALIRLDDIDLSSEPVMGWYKLYHSSSVVGTAASMSRKDSESSLVDIDQRRSHR